MSENLPRLYFLSENTSELLPEWAYFLMRLGLQLATIPNDDQRVVVGLAIPTRMFASSLVATGVVLSKAGVANTICTKQLKYICGQKPGTAVHVRTDHNRKLKGKIDRFEDFEGEPYIYICTANKSVRGFPLSRYASRITVSEGDVRLPKNQQRGYLMETPSKFLQCCLGEKLSQRYILDSSFDSLIIGKLSVIEREASLFFVSCKVSNQSADVSGNLQEMLRVRQFSGANKSYRTQCVSSSNMAPENEIDTQIPPVVIYDGAVSYLRLGHKWQSAHQIVLLDRTERQFFDAIELLNQNYAYRLPDGRILSIKIPNGIEVMVYRDRIQ